MERFDSKGMDMILTGGGWGQRHDVGKQDGMWINGKELGGQGRCQWNSTTQASTERDETVWDGTK